jgi:hypothetical protein
MLSHALQRQAHPVAKFAIPAVVCYLNDRMAKLIDRTSQAIQASRRLQMAAALIVSLTAVLFCCRADSTPASPESLSNIHTMEVAQAVMVTVELDFGSKVPSIAEAISQVERRYQPEDGTGRTFAILDAYGEPTPDGKLHMSMHVSSEKPGTGSLIFRRTGEVLWSSRIVPATKPPSSAFAGKNLLITLDDEKGKSRMLDGSRGADSILDAYVRDLAVPVRDFWPDGEERQVTFFYSACGCPVKVMARRVGEATVRTKDMPVIFPDDPAVAAMIAKLMRW